MGKEGLPYQHGIPKEGFGCFLQPKAESNEYKRPKHPFPFEYGMFQGEQ